MVLSCDCALAQEDRRRPLTAVALVARTISCGICGRCIGTGAGISPHISVFRCHVNSSNAPASCHISSHSYQ